MISVNKEGKVNVKINPSINTGMLCRQLNNETITFYIHPYDQDDF